MAVAVTNRVIVRNGLGRFIADVEGAATRAIQEILDEGVELSRTLAPSRARLDPRTPKLKASFFTQVLSRTSGVWGNNARHSRYVEEGTAPHPIRSDVTFFWEKHWRMWTPGDPETQEINHPGADAQPYLRPAYIAMRPRVQQIMKKHYPG